jgi:biopolymer transport protein ExbD
MRKSLKKNQLGEGDIPVASFSDLAFLLIIFFILTTTLQKVSGFKADIPSGIHDEIQQKEKTTTVTIHGNQISLNDKNVSLQELRRQIGEMDLRSKTGEAKIVLLTASGNVKYQTYYETMASISAAGGNIAMVREEKETKP